jgi:hypothetical protein
MIARIRESCIESDDLTHSFEKIVAACYGSSFRVRENVSFVQIIVL